MGDCADFLRRAPSPDELWDQIGREDPDQSSAAIRTELIEAVLRDPFTGIGKSEPLKYHLPGAWSRRIDDEHRLVYIVTEAEVRIALGSGGL
jgi:Txe/YoeB family toxin of toxin-antitoxin system